MRDDDGGREKRWITIGRVWCVSALSISTKVWRQCAAAITNDLMAWLERTTSTWYRHPSVVLQSSVSYSRQSVALLSWKRAGEKKNPFRQPVFFFFFFFSRTVHSTCYYASIVVKPLDCYRITIQRPKILFSSITGWQKEKKIEKFVQQT